MADISNVDVVDIKDPELFDVATVLTDVNVISRRNSANKIIPGENLPALIITAGSKGDITTSNPTSGWTINSNAVTTAKIADANVTTAKIADANVTSAKIADGNVTTAKIADSNVTTAKIADGNITAAKLATTGVTAGSYSNASITVDAQGRLTAASSGSAGSAPTEASITVTSGNSGYSLRVVYTGSTAPTASFASNKYTIVIPSGTRILSANLIVVSADIQSGADGGGVTNWVQVEFQGTGGNTSVANLRVPTIQKMPIPISGALSVSNPGTFDIDNNPALAVVGAASGNITLRISGLSVGGQGYLLTFTDI